MKTIETFPLWAFSNNPQRLRDLRLIVTRGRTEQEARSWACAVAKEPMIALPFVPIRAAEAYSLNHPPGWLHRKPQWLQFCENQSVRVAP